MAALLRRPPSLLTHTSNASPLRASVNLKMGTWLGLGLGLGLGSGLGLGLGLGLYKVRLRALADLITSALCACATPALRPRRERR